jgi:hypothetical protein
VSVVLSGTGTRNVLPTFNTAKNPLSPNRVSPMVFPPTELTLVDLDSLLRTAELLRASFQVNHHGLSAEHPPVGNRVISESMFMLGVVDWFAAQDIVSEVQKFLEGNISVVEPRNVSNKPRRRARGSTCLPTTSPSKTIGNSWISERCHITTAGVTLHLTANYSYGLQELNTSSVVAE